MLYRTAPLSINPPVVADCLGGTDFWLKFCCAEPAFDEAQHTYACSFESREQVRLCKQAVEANNGTLRSIDCSAEHEPIKLQHGTSGARAVASHGLSAWKLILLCSLMMSICSACPVLRRSHEDPDRWATLDFYEDKNCEFQVWSQGYNGGPELFPEGRTSCVGLGFRQSAHAYAKLADPVTEDLQLIVTEARSCDIDTVNGRMMAFFTARGSRCVDLGALSGDEAVSIYPRGGYYDPSHQDSIHKTDLKHMPHKRSDDDLGCQAFNWDDKDNEDVYTNSVQITDTLDCHLDTECAFTISEQQTKTLTTTWSINGGIKIKWFDVSASFGQSHAESLTTSTTESQSVPGGQKGFLSTYAKATRYKGYYSECKTADGTAPGGVLALMTNGLHYRVVLTNE